MKNLKIYLDKEEDFDNFSNPKHLPMKFQVSGKSKTFSRWDDPWEPRHFNDKYRMYCKRIDKILWKNVGKSFDEVYSKIIKILPIKKVFDYGSNLRDYFKNNFYSDNDYHVYRWGNCYRINEDGLIEYIPKKYGNRHNPKLILEQDYDNPFYKIDHTILKRSKHIQEEIIQRLGEGILYRLLFTDALTKNQYEKYRYYKRCKVIDEITTRYITQTYVMKKDKSYKRLKAEQEDSIRKKRREEKRRLDEWRNMLLGYLEWEKRQKEEERNTVTRDRMGFTDESFKGEFYHGQKRKK